MESNTFYAIRAIFSKYEYNRRQWVGGIYIYISSCLQVFAVDVFQAVVSEETQDDLKHALGIRVEIPVGVCVQALDEVGDHVVQTFFRQ